jgi:hypothetical protein
MDSPLECWGPKTVVLRSQTYQPHLETVSSRSIPGSVEIAAPPRSAPSRRSPRPGICRVTSHPDMHNLARSNLQHEEHIHHLQQITGPDCAGMIVDEGGPGLLTTPRGHDLSGILLDGAFADPQAKLEKIAADVFSTPQMILHN